MGSVIGIKGQTLNIDLLEDSRDNGWIISAGKAVHSGCNQGNIELLNANYTVGMPNVFRYVVSGYSSGGVNISVGGDDGVTRSANGQYEDVFTPYLNDKVLFFSDGNLTIDVLAIYPQSSVSNATTIGFSESDNKWVSYYSYEPEMMIGALNEFFTSKNGDMWKHNVNELRNNFYGEQFGSKIIFYCNLNPTEVKNYFTLREKSNKVWQVTDIYIKPSEGKSEGQRSRLKKGRFRRLQGDWFAAFLRNLSDPRFDTELDALMKGSQLQGNIMKITIENDDTVEVRLLSVDVEVGPQNYTY